MPGPTGNDEDNRAARRQRVLKQGKILLATGLAGTDCTIRDISDTGARLICGDSATVPDEFRLVYPVERIMRDVKVIWRKSGQVGVQFISDARRAPLLKW